MAEVNETGVLADATPGSAAPQAATNCAEHGTPLKGGMKYQGICLDCQPHFAQWCSGCEHRLWDCMCIKPHTWE